MYSTNQSTPPTTTFTTSPTTPSQPPQHDPTSLSTSLTDAWNKLDLDLIHLRSMSRDLQLHLASAAQCSTLLDPVPMTNAHVQTVAAFPTTICHSCTHYQTQIAFYIKSLRDREQCIARLNSARDQCRRRRHRLKSHVTQLQAQLNAKTASIDNYLHVKNTLEVHLQNNQANLNKLCTAFYSFADSMDYNCKTENPLFQQLVKLIDSFSANTNPMNQVLDTNGFLTAATIHHQQLSDHSSVSHDSKSPSLLVPRTSSSNSGTSGTSTNLEAQDEFRINTASALSWDTPASSARDTAVPVNPVLAISIPPPAEPYLSTVPTDVEMQTTGHGLLPSHKPGGVPHSSVVRDKSTRKQLHGQDCACCRDWYQAAYGGTVEPAQQIQSISRHRSMYLPPPTPEGFWDLGFPSSSQPHSDTELEIKENKNMHVPLILTPPSRQPSDLSAGSAASLSPSLLKPPYATVTQSHVQQLHPSSEGNPADRALGARRTLPSIGESKVFASRKRKSIF